MEPERVQSVSTKKTSRLMAIFDRTNDYLAYFSCLILFFIMFAVAAEIIQRKLIGRSIIWSVEYAEYGLFYLTFLAAAWVLRRDAHVSVDVLVSHLGIRAKQLLDLVMSIIAALLCMVITWYGTTVTIDMYMRGAYRETSMLATPLFITLIPIPIGCFLLTVQFLRRTLNTLKDFRATAKRVRNEARADFT